MNATQFKKNCRLAAKEASRLDKETATWEELHNALFGAGAVLADLFPDVESRRKFSRTEEHQAIQEMISAKGVEDVSGKLVVRMPKSVHAALIKEAKAEGVSMNQLIVAKLSCQLQSVVQ